MEQVQGLVLAVFCRQSVNLVVR